MPYTHCNNYNKLVVFSIGSGLDKRFIFNKSEEDITIKHTGNTRVLKQEAAFVFDINLDKIEILDPRIDFWRDPEISYSAEWKFEMEGDSKNQLTAIGGDYLKKYKIPSDITAAFVIGNPGEGDGVVFNGGSRYIDYDE